MSSVRDCLFKILAGVLKPEAVSSIRNVRTRHAVVTVDPRNMVVVTVNKGQMSKCHIPQLELYIKTFESHGLSLDPVRLREAFHGLHFCVKHNMKFHTSTSPS